MLPTRDKDSPMDFEQVLRKRRMVRNYRNDPVPDDVLERIAAAALRAPSAGNSQAVRLVIVTDPRTRSAIARIAGEDQYVALGFDPWISRAPAHLIITVSENIYRERYREPDKLGPDGEIDWPVPYWWVDAGAALMAVLLAAVDQGVVAGFLGVHSLPELAGLLDIPVEHVPIGVVTIGYPLPDRRSVSLDRERGSPAEVIHRERWRG